MTTKTTRCKGGYISNVITISVLLWYLPVVPKLLDSFCGQRTATTLGDMRVLLYRLYEVSLRVVLPTLNRFSLCPKISHQTEDQNLDHIAKLRNDDASCTWSIDLKD
uniref:Uncharacterized protein n=1 Tax=Glossina brevipalpis TaxID=37001 RepID=A0A1A9W7X5_9MUSC